MENVTRNHKDTENTPVLVVLSERSPAQLWEIEKATENETRNYGSTETISVVIVSDDRSPERSWDEEVNVVDAFSRQVGVNIIEILLVENSRFKDSFPVEKFKKFLNFRIIFCEKETGQGLKNVGVQEAQGSLIALFEADSCPNPDCLSQLYTTLCENPDAAACSARTVYRGYEKNSLCRCLTFIDRAQENHTYSVSNNAALLRASVAKSALYVEDIESPFVAGSERSARLRKAGHKFVSNSHAIVVHEFEGFGFEAEFRRQVGFRIIKRRETKQRLIILRTVYKTSLRLLKGVYRANKEQLRVTDRPLAFALCFVLPLLEVPGMLDAFNGKPNTGARFR